MKFKICGLTRQEDAAAARAAGASYGGIILAPGGPRSVDDATAGELVATNGLTWCGVFVDEPLAVLIRRSDTIGLSVVQLHGDEDQNYVAQLRERSGVRIWKAIRPRTGAEFLGAVERFASLVDGLLVDGWSARARGGTGTRFPWEEVARHRSAVPIGLELIAAGGLDDANVAEAIRIVSPDSVDVSSGVESAPGIKDANRINAFAAAVRSAASNEIAG